MCDVTHSYVFRHTFVCVYWLSYTRHKIHTIQKTPPPPICVTWLIHMCDATHSFVCIDSHIHDIKYKQTATCIVCTHACIQSVIPDAFVQSILADAFIIVTDLHAFIYNIIPDAFLLWATHMHSFKESYQMHSYWERFRCIHIKIIPDELILWATHMHSYKISYQMHSYCEQPRYIHIKSHTRCTHIMSNPDAFI